MATKKSTLRLSAPPPGELASSAKVKQPARHFAAGGILGASPVDPNGSDYDAINAEKTVRWAADDAMSKMNSAAGTRTERAAFGQQLNSIASKRPELFDADTLESQMHSAGTKTARTAIGNAMGVVSGYQAAKSFPSITPGIASGTIPQETTFQQDSDARQSRITAYADRLRGMETAARTDPNTLHAAYADGGKVETADELMARMTAKYGAPSAGPTQQPAVQQPAQQPQQKAQPLPQQQGIIGILKGRAAQIDKAVNGYANGGEPGAAIAAQGITVGMGGKIEGKGSPTSDSIPATVRETGEQIRVSTQERILSKAQDSFLEEIAQASGFESLNDMLQAGTGQQVGPVIKSGRRAAATGMEPEYHYDPALDASGRTPEGLMPGSLASPGSIEKPAAAGGLSSDRVAAAIASPPTLGSAQYGRSEASGGLTRAAAAGAAAEASRDTVGYKPEINGITWNAKSFNPTKETMTPGTGAIAITSGPNAGKNVAIGPQSYTAADGSSTSDWSKTAQYSQGVAQANKDRETLATMQRDRLERDAYSPEITDPRAQINARQQLHDIDAKAGKEGEAYGRMLDNQGKLTKLNSDGQMAGLQAQYLGETDPARREALAEKIRGVSGKGTAPGPVNLQHVETEKGSMIFDPRTGRMVPAVGADGAPVGSGKALTEYQEKSTGFGILAQEASRIIDTVGQGGKVQPSLLKRTVEAVPLVGEGLGMAANHLQSPEQQQVEQAQRDYVNSILRQESGAAISESEFRSAQRQYFPQPGDSPEVVVQKKANREAAINGFRISAGPGARNIGGTPAQSQPQQPQQPAAAPKVGMVDGKHVFLGGNPADPASWAEVR